MKINFHITPELSIAAMGIICIFFLAGYALFKGIDGVMFSGAMAGIGGIIGWVFKGIRNG